MLPMIENTVEPVRGRAQERAATGKAARRAAPRGSLGAWDPQARKTSALEIVLGQSKERLPSLAPLRHARMATSPWHYYRGAAAVMAADLATAPNTGLAVQMCGDAHVLNFGLWATPERNLAFDLRDFDETLPGPFEWDVKRLVTSLVVAARLHGRESIGERAVAAALASYRSHMSGFVTASELEIWYDLTHVKRLLDAFTEPDVREAVSRHIDKKSLRSNSRGALHKLTENTVHGPRITESAPFRVHLNAAERSHALSAFEGYRSSLAEHRRHLLDRFDLVDVVRQVVGVGSVGMRVYLFLLEGRRGDDPLFLQLKQAGPSVYEECLGASDLGNHGRRVVVGKQLIQSATDIFVGWTSAKDIHYYGRQFRDMKVIPDSDRLPWILVDFATACGAVLARAHARTGDPAAIASYIGRGKSFDKALRRFAVSYADQNDRDHAELVAAIARGEIQVAATAW
jgi:uncharacterized protein (DUF2252 family)